VPNLTVDAGMFVPTADLAVTKNDGVVTVNTGSSTTYTLTLTNNGPSAADGATIRDAAAAGLTKTAIGVCTPAGGAVCPAVGLGATQMNIASLEAGTVVVPTLPSGGSISFTVTATVTATTGSVTNTFTATTPAGTTDPTPANNTASDTDDVLSTAIGDFVWNDLNRDGIQDGGEPGINNVTVRLYDTATNTLQGTTTTNAAGIYGFTGLVPGDYYVVFTLPAGYTFSPMDAGVDDTLDSDANTATGRTGNYTLLATDPDLTVDAGMYILPNADLAVTKDDGVVNVISGSSTTYTLTLTNKGPNAADNSTISDPAATGLTKTAIGACTAGGGAVCPAVGAGAAQMNIASLEAGTVVVPTLPSGGSISFTVTATVTATTGNVTNTFTATTPPGITDPTPADNTATDTDQITPQPGIQVIKSVSKVVFVNPRTFTVTYRIAVKNTGAVILNNVQVTDDLKKTFALAVSFTVKSVSSSTFTVNPAYNGRTNINLLKGTDSLTTGQQKIILLVVQVDTGGKAHNYTNTAKASGQPPSGPPVVDTSSVTGPGLVDPAVSKAADVKHAKVGDIITFTITVTNYGNLPAKDVVVTDTLPTVLDLISATASRGTVTITGRTVEVNLGDVLPAEVIKIIVKARVNTGAKSSFTNTVLLKTSSLTDIISNDTSNVKIDMGGAPSLPNTGFAANQLTLLPAQPKGLAYFAFDQFSLAIPQLGIQMPIVGVPQIDNTWDVSWLDADAGWLNGTAFPTWSGNSVLTGHVYLPNGKPGPFVNLGTLKYGDQIIVNFAGNKYIYAVRTVAITNPDDRTAFQHEDLSWLTLITCKQYDQATDSYKLRTVVRAILVSVTSGY
jgi:LPXTG-site transpeptidase (sortase) family protein